MTLAVATSDLRQRDATSTSVQRATVLLGGQHADLVACEIPRRMGAACVDHKKRRGTLLILNLGSKPVSGMLKRCSRRDVADRR
jgi:hypothetical protein